MRLWQTAVNEKLHPASNGCGLGLANLASSSVAVYANLLPRSIDDLWAEIMNRRASERTDGAGRTGA